MLRAPCPARSFSAATGVLPYDGATPVGDLYQTPCPFTGTIERVVVSVTGEPYRNTAKAVQVAITRD